MKIRLPLVFALLATAASALGIGVATYLIMNKPAFSPNLQAKIVNVMVESMKGSKSPGMSLGIWIPGEGEFIVQKGFADIKTKREIKDTDKFRIGSLTKSFTATVVLQIVDEGKIKLSDKLSKYFPKIPNSNNITIRQLLDMTSGLHSYTEIPWLEKAFFKDRMAPYAPNELVSIGLSHRPDFKPGKGFHYSNTNYVLLGMIAEKITGREIEEEVKTRIIDRLALKSTSFPKGVSRLKGGHIRGYMVKNGKYEDWTVQNISWGWAAGAMVSNLYDLKTYIKAINDGTLLSKKMQKERLMYWVDAGVPKAPTLKYGLGVFTMGGFIGHNGGLPGYVDMAMYDPKTGAVIVFMLNIQNEDGPSTLQVFEKLLKILYPKRKI